jgi:hypothetical protein
LNKTAQCGICGVDVVVGIKAKLKSVRCPEHALTKAAKSRGRRNALDPFEPGIPLDVANARCTGAVIVLKRALGGQEWTEEITLTAIRSVDVGVQAFAVAGANLQKFDPHRESGQNRSFLLSEVVEVR